MSDLSCDIIAVLRTDRIDEYNRIDLRVVKWSTSEQASIEKRRMWTRKDGTDVHRKMTGLNEDDIIYLRDNFDDVVKLMRGGSE